MRRMLAPLNARSKKHKQWHEKPVLSHVEGFG
jgi:hypothetical protein